MKLRNWDNLIYYGEVVGFVVAWAIGLLVATHGARDSGGRADSDNLASASSAAIQTRE